MGYPSPGDLSALSFYELRALCLRTSSLYRNMTCQFPKVKSVKRIDGIIPGTIFALVPGADIALAEATLNLENSGADSALLEVRCWDLLSLQEIPALDGQMMRFTIPAWSSRLGSQVIRTRTSEEDGTNYYFAVLQQDQRGSFRYHPASISFRSHDIPVYPFSWSISATEPPLSSSCWFIFTLETNPTSSSSS